MRIMSQTQALDKLSDNDMTKQIIRKILNTPKPDYEAMKRQARIYEEELISEMSEEERMKLMEINSGL